MSRLPAPLSSHRGFCPAKLLTLLACISISCTPHTPQSPEPSGRQWEQKLAPSSELAGRKLAESRDGPWIVRATAPAGGPGSAGGASLSAPSAAKGRRSLSAVYSMDLKSDGAPALVAGAAGAEGAVRPDAMGEAEDAATEAKGGGEVLHFAAGGAESFDRARASRPAPGRVAMPDTGTSGAAPAVGGDAARFLAEPASRKPGASGAEPSVPTEPSGATGSTPEPAARIVAMPLRAGFTDDNIDFEKFLAFLKEWGARPEVAQASDLLDVRDRRFIRVVNTAGKPVPGARVLIVDEAADEVLWGGTTYGDGRVPYYPHVPAARGVSEPSGPVQSPASTSPSSPTVPASPTTLSSPPPAAAPTSPTAPTSPAPGEVPPSSVSSTSGTPPAAATSPAAEPAAPAGATALPPAARKDLIVEVTFGGARKLVRWDGGGQGGETADRNEGGTGELTVEIDAKEPVKEPIALDVLFLIDTTGSMGDEIDRIKATLLEVTRKLRSIQREFELRYAAVLYRDLGDEYVTRAHPFTGDIDAFDRALASVAADGGGDEAESVNQGLAEAVGRADWREGAAKIVFLVADAPPHMDYSGDVRYGESLKAAVDRGIRIHSVAASGLNPVGTFIFRQIAQFTRGKFIFIEYGSSAESAAAHGVKGEVKSNNLDDIIFERIKEEIAGWGRA